MTIITIEQSTIKPQKIQCKTALEAVEELLDAMGYVLLSSVENQEMRAKIEKHERQNRGRAVSTYDNI